MSVAGIIEEDWSAEPGIKDACLSVFNALMTRSTHPDHYTFDDLKEFAKNAESTQFSRALLYLSTPRLKVLRTCLMYEYRGMYLELPEEELNHFSLGEAVIHPEFGEPIAKSDILICFTVAADLSEGASSQ